MVAWDWDLDWDVDVAGDVDTESSPEDDGGAKLTGRRGTEAAAAYLLESEWVGRPAEATASPGAELSL